MGLGALGILSTISRLTITTSDLRLSLSLMLTYYVPARDSLEAFYRLSRSMGRGPQAAGRLLGPHTLLESI